MYISQTSKRPQAGGSSRSEKARRRTGGGSGSGAKRILPILAGVLALLLIGGGVTYFLKNRERSQAKDDGAQSLSAVMRSDEFKQADLEQQAGKVDEVLQQMSREGIIESDYTYLEDEMLFTFSFTDGSNGGVCLRNMDNASYGEASGTYPNLENAYAPYTRGLILNGFEDSPYRRDFYRTMQGNWTAAGNSLELDEDVTVDDFKRLNSFDFVVFAMHGYHYNGRPILSLNQQVTGQSDAALDYELRQRGSVVKVFCGDYEYHYWLMPEFFKDNYGSGGLNGLVVFSESCCFAGCDCGEVPYEDALGNSLVSAGAGAVIGFHNSVGANYSRDMMLTTLTKMAQGRTAEDSLTAAMQSCGASDGWTDPPDHKFEAYPVLFGSRTALMHLHEPEPEVTAEPPATEAQRPDPTSQLETTPPVQPGEVPPEEQTFIAGVRADTVESYMAKRVPKTVYSFTVVDLKTGYYTGSDNQEDPMSSSVLIGVPVMYAINQLAANGEMSLNDTVAIQSLYGGGRGVITESRMTIRELLQYMLNASSGSAINNLANYVGMDRINRICHDAGYYSVSFANYIGSPGITDYTSSDNYVSTVDLCGMLYELYNGDGVIDRRFLENNFGVTIGTDQNNGLGKRIEGNVGSFNGLKESKYNDLILVERDGKAYAIAMMAHGDAYKSIMNAMDGIGDYIDGKLME